MIVNTRDGAILLDGVLDDVKPTITTTFDFSTSWEMKSIVRGCTSAGEFNKIMAIKTIRDMVRLKYAEAVISYMKAGLDYDTAQDMANSLFPDIGLAGWKAIVEAIYDKIK